MTSLGGYEMGRQIGAGASGTVWEAFRRGPGPVVQVVAVKRLRGAAADPEEADQLRREAMVLTELDHPHIVRVLEVLPDGEGVAICMQYAPGGSLEDLLTRRGRLTPGETVAVAVPVAEALASAHRKGILHVDVKPANILFTSDGEPLLGDFGVARTLGRLTAVLGGGGQRPIAGTAHYLAPELLDGAVPDARSDVYSLAVVCYEALTGKRPYDAALPLAVLRAADVGRHELLSARADVPAPLAAVIERAMARDPDHRIATADLLARALREAIPQADVHLPGPAPHPPPSTPPAPPAPLAPPAGTMPLSPPDPPVGRPAAGGPVEAHGGAPWPPPTTPPMRPGPPPPGDAGRPPAGLSPPDGPGTPKDPDGQPAEASPAGTPTSPPPEVVIAPRADRPGSSPSTPTASIDPDLPSAVASTDRQLPSPTTGEPAGPVDAAGDEPIQPRPSTGDEPLGSGRWAGDGPSGPRHAPGSDPIGPGPAAEGEPSGPRDAGGRAPTEVAQGTSVGGDRDRPPADQTRTFGPRPPQPDPESVRRRPWLPATVVAGAAALVLLYLALGPLRPEKDDDCPDLRRPFPEAGTQIVVGDPEGDGCATYGIYQLRTPAQDRQDMFLTIHVDGRRRQVRLGELGDRLFLGDWDCDGADTPGVYRRRRGEVQYYDGWPGRGDEPYQPDRTEEVAPRSRASLVEREASRSDATEEPGSAGDDGRDRRDPRASEDAGADQERSGRESAGEADAADADRQDRQAGEGQAGQDDEESDEGDEGADRGPRPRCDRIAVEELGDSGDEEPGQAGS